ncbi:uncharacterized protein LOC110456651 isoform X3 [Mizuhopecten yessoensis]|uniref:uncharacterized protein LOC110456651 isoform X2 n=1 Tax=Mizuhopecten yessoensis TaxID=6573 RepID=UPI000B457E55|nr:uncharacterized protein LOC110456651 isoform X2 [Mizuhopecten yessoensis]XP_021363184.1 uncharacterized protein LOC110456651 isoform X3 [Mizuhopecten yessoensis]
MISQMEVLTEAEDIKLNRSSTQVILNADYKGSNQDTSDEDNITEEELTESDENDGVIKYGSTSSVAFNPDFRNNMEESGEDSFTEDDMETENSESEHTDPTDESGPKDSESEYTDPTDESGPKEYPMIEGNLDNGIIVRYPENYRSHFPYVSRPLQLQSRNTQLAELKNTLVGSKLITDMFGIYGKSATVEDKLASILFADKCEGDIRISVTVKAKLSPHFQYFAFLRRNGDWVKLPVQMEGNIAEFEGGTFDILFLTSTPIIETITLGPEGKVFTSDYDKNIKLIFPRNCVWDTEILHVQIIPSSNNGPICMDDQPCIIGATKSIHVDHRKGIFKQQIEIHLELCLFDNSTDPDLAKYNFVDVHAVNKQEGEIVMRQLPTESYTRVVRGFSLCMKIDDFDSHSIQLGIHDKMVTQTGKLRARMAHDEIFHCHILVFMSENIHNYQGKSIRVECVENKDVQKTIDKLHAMNYGFIELTKCRSPPIFIEDGERIRISLHGGIKLPWGFRKDQMIISFLREGLHTHIVFPVVTQFGNRPSHFGYIDFDRAEGQKEMLYHTFFDVDFPFPGMRLEPGSETASLSSMELSPQFTRSAQGVISEATSLKSMIGSGSDSASSSKASLPEGHTSTTANIMLKINSSLSEMLINTNWKFVLRAVFFSDSELGADSIISEAEKNNSGNVREAIYSVLTAWTYKTNHKTPKEMFDAIIRGLKEEDFEQIALTLKERHERDVQS